MTGTGDVTVSEREPVLVGVLKKKSEDEDGEKDKIRNIH